MKNNRYRRINTLSKNNALRNSSFLTLSELNQVKSCINIFQSQGITPVRKRKFDELFLSNSITLKNKIIDYDRYHERKGLKSDYEKEKEKKEKEILFKAQRDREESLDEVKTMNSILLSAKYAAIRDKQIEEKKRMNLEKKRIEEKLYLIGEYEKLKEEINRKRLEKKLNEKRIEDGKELEKQIVLNKKLKEDHKILLRKEYEENIKYQQNLKKEELEKLKKEKEKGKKIIQEMLEANKKALVLKKIKKLKEIQEDNNILEYNKQKYLEEQNKQKELNELKHLKEMEIAKLREKQRKMIDNRYIINEIYNKRTAEEVERAERKKEKDEMLKKNKLKEEIKKENNRLLEFKNKIKIEETAQKDKEFVEMVKKKKLEIESEKEKEKKAIEVMLRYKEDLMKMIKVKDEDKKLKKREIIEEGKKLKQSQEDYYNRLQNIKSRKIEELKNLNVPKKYIYDLEKFAFKKSI